jgi:hypothetical protein
MYPVIPQFYQPQPMAPPPAQPAPANNGQVISQPQSFVVPMGGTPQYSMYGAPGTSAYYPYGYAAPYYGASTASAPGAMSHSTTPTKQPEQNGSTAHLNPNITSSLAGVGSNQGAWSDDETARLKKLSEQSREAGHSGDAAWDWVVQQWGQSRTRFVSFKHFQGD